MAEGKVSYQIDSQERIVAVGDDWLDFARGNGAPELTAEAVVGACWSDFVADPETRSLYGKIFDRVRLNDAELIVPFRCDSPDRFRFMRLVISPGLGGTLTCLGLLEREQERPFYSILDKAFPRSDRSLPICSLCRKVEVAPKEWLEIEDAVVRLDLLDSTRVPRLEERVCAECGHRALHDGVEASPGAA
jgi:hypothetical protein